MKFIFKHYRRQQLIHEEVVCQKHRDEMSGPGEFMETPTPKEQAAGIKITFTPFDGAKECDCCAEEEQRKGSAA